MKKSRPSYQQLEKRVAVSEPIVDALKRHEVDAIVGEQKIAFLLLREVREALVNSEAAFRALFDLPGVGMLQADPPAFRFTQVNQKLCEITGYSARELSTQTYLGLTHPQDRQRDMDALARVLQAKANSWSIDKRCLRKDGSVVPVRVNGAALRDVAGRVVRLLAMISDLPAPRATRTKKVAAGKTRRR